MVPIALAPVDWVAVIRRDRRTETWAKPATLAGLLVVALVLGAASSAPGRWMLVALALGMAGDVALLGESVGRFRAGVAAFLVGHVAWIVAFATLGLPRPDWSWLVLALVAASGLVTRDVVPAAHRAHGSSVSLPVAVYTLVIATMLVCAWFTGAPLIAAGAAIFVASDSTLSVDRFVRPLPSAHLLVMITYHVGQALMVLGVLDAIAG
ncbi:MAG: hypothetical protein JWM79_207 [Nocardioides sp.]|nr:hypothetical protein [Nocardioides sp.]